MMTKCKSYGIEIIAALLIALGASGSCLSEPDKTTSVPVSVPTARITETAGGFSYVPPAGWTIGTGIPFNSLKYRGYVGDLDGGLKGALIAQDANSPKALDAFVQNEILEYQKQTPTPSILSNTAFITYSGLHGVKLVVELTQNDVLKRLVFYMFSGKEDQKIIMLAAWLASFGDKYEPITDASMKTFALVAPEEASQSVPSAPDVTAVLVPSDYKPASYSNAPFDLSLTQLPANYKGVDPALLFAGLGKSYTTKSEFETTQAYHDRLQKADSSPVIGSLTPQSLMALRIEPSMVVASYDADKGLMQVKIKESGEGNWQLFEREVGPSTYEAQNGFGATFTVTKGAIFPFDLDMKNGKDFSFQRVTDPDSVTDSIAVSIPMNVQTAMRVKPDIGVLVVCKLQAQQNGECPYLNITSTHRAPTMQAPIDIDESKTLFEATFNEVLFYDASTGEILQTIVPKNKKP